MAQYKKGKATRLSNNFKSTEFDCKCGKNCGDTLIDAYLVVILQRIRNHFARPVIINSGYRCIAHNKAVGGSKSSRHTRGQAADIVVKGVSPRKVAQYAESIGVLGIGLYDTFTHIDTRQNKYYWYSHDEKRMSTFK